MPDLPEIGKVVRSSTLIQRLDRRRTEPIGAVDTRQFEAHYARVPNWLVQRSVLLQQLQTRYTNRDAELAEGGELPFAVTGHQLPKQEFPGNTSLEMGWRDAPRLPAVSPEVYPVSPAQSTTETSDGGTFRISRRAMLPISGNDQEGRVASSTPFDRSTSEGAIASEPPAPSPLSLQATPDPNPASRSPTQPEVLEQPQTGRLQQRSQPEEPEPPPLILRQKASEQIMSSETALSPQQEATRHASSQGRSDRGGVSSPSMHVSSEWSVLRTGIVTTTANNPALILRQVAANSPDRPLSPASSAVATTSSPPTFVEGQAVLQEQAAPSLILRQQTAGQIAAAGTAPSPLPFVMPQPVSPEVQKATVPADNGAEVSTVAGQAVLQEQAAPSLILRQQTAGQIAAADTAPSPLPSVMPQPANSEEIARKGTIAPPTDAASAGTIAHISKVTTTTSDSASILRRVVADFPSRHAAATSSALPTNSSPTAFPLVRTGAGIAAQLVNAVPPSTSEHLLKQPSPLKEEQFRPDEASAQQHRLAIAPEIISPSRAGVESNLIWRKPAVVGDDRGFQPALSLTTQTNGQRIDRVINSSEGAIESGTVNPLLSGGNMPLPGSPQAQGVNIAQIAEQVSRILARKLTIERERRGLNSW